MPDGRNLTIYTAQSRRDQTLQPVTLTVSEFFDRLSKSVPLDQTWGEYQGLPKAHRDDLKDKGGFVAGVLDGGHRRSGCVLSRCAAIMDVDNLPSGTTEDVARRVAGLGVAYCIYGTASHHPSKPRLRVVIPFIVDVTADEYRPVVRLLAQKIQREMNWFDVTCDQPERLMYFPSHCSDVGPVFYADATLPLCDPVALLATLTDWRDVSTWPSWPGSDALPRLAAKQGDPTAKTGLVGAFCRVYDVESAMEKFLPGVYTVAGGGRYTFTGGSSFGGAVLYDNGKFLYSHHATDPCGSRLVNAWDLVRLHRFGVLDDDAAPGTPGGRLPSYLAMQQLAQADTAVQRERATESFQAAQDADTVDDEAAVQLHTFAGQGLSLAVVRAALRAYGITCRTNEVTGRLEVSGLPSEYSATNAPNVLPVWLLDKLRGVGVKHVSKNSVCDYLAVCADADRYSPVCDMLAGSQWDSIERLPELLRVMGLQEGSLSAVLVRKWLHQTVALAFNDGSIGADGVLVLQGPQGCGKTSFFRKLALHPSWFCEGAAFADTADSKLLITGAWITELGELERSLRFDAPAIKAFLTGSSDRIRAPYAREATDRPRRTSIGATVNSAEFLSDLTGDRRFWVVSAERFDLPGLLGLSDDWIMQLWAEVYAAWIQDKDGFRLTGEERAALAVSNREYRVLLPAEEEILAAFNFDLPAERWGEFRSTELQRQLSGLSMCRPEQVGRALTKICQEDSRVSWRRLHGAKVYRLPILPAFTVISGGGVHPPTPEKQPYPVRVD